MKKRMNNLKYLMVLIPMLSVMALEPEWQKVVVPVKNDSVLLIRQDLVDTLKVESKKIVAEKSEAQTAKGKVYKQNTVQGILLSADANNPLKNALITLSQNEKMLKTKSDEAGLFKFENILPGIIKIEIEKNGFQSLNKEIETKANGELLELMLAKKVITAQTMNIQKPTQQGGKENLLANRKKSNAVVDGMGADQIAKGTDSDAGALAKRVTGTSVVGGKYVFVRGLGERYTNMTLNGLPVPTPEKDKRVVPQDLFPANALESFSIYKTFTPDLMPDFAGGSVALVTKGIPEKNSLKIKVGVGGVDYLGDNSFTRIGKDRLSYDGGDGLVSYLGYDDGTRKKPNGVPTAVDRSWTADQLAREAWKFNNNWNFDTTQIFINQNYSAEFAKVYQIDDEAKLGFLSAIDFSNKFDQEENTTYTLRRDNVLDSNNRTVTDSVTRIDAEGNEFRTFENLYWINPVSNKMKSSGVTSTRKTVLLNLGYEDKDKKLWLKNLYAHLSQDKATITRREDSETSNENSGILEEIFTTEYSSRAILTSQAGFGMYMGKSFLDSMSGAVGFGMSLGETPDQKAYLFTRNKLSATAKNDTLINGKTIKAGGSYEYLSDPRFVIGPSYGVRFYDDFQEVSYNARFDQNWIVPPVISVEDTLFKNDGWFSYWSLPTLNTGVFANYKTREYNLSRYEYLGLEYSIDQFGGYDIVDDVFQSDSVYKYVKKNGSGFAPTPSDYDNYQANESEVATYFQFNTGAKIFSIPVSIEFGMRFQLYQNTVDIPYSGKEFLTNPEKRAEKNVTIESNEFNIYPSYGISFDWFENTKMKFYYTQTIVRPELRELIPTNFYDYEEDTEVSGNVDLVNTNINHFDSRFDWYLPYNQIMSTSFFYKKFEKPIESYIDAASSPVVKKYVNAKEAFVRGVEFEMDFNLGRGLSLVGMDAKWNELLSLYVNAAWIESEVKIDPQVATAALLTSEKRSMIGQSPWLYNVRLSLENEIGKAKISQSLLYNLSGARIVSLGNLNVGDTYEEPFASLDYSFKYGIGSHSIAFKMKNLLNSKKELRVDEVNKDIKRESLDQKYVDELYSKYKDKIIEVDDKGIEYGLSYTYSFL